jgi:O-antigen/teichoic acid export membrane protein
MPRPHYEDSSLRTDFGWVLLGNAVYAVGQWITLVLLAKLMRPEVVGQYALGVAIAVPVFMLTSLQLRLVLASDIFEKTHFGNYLGLRLLSTALGLFIICGISRASRLRGQLYWVVVMVGMTLAIEAMSDIYYGRLQLHDQMVRIAKSMIARSMLSALGLTVGVFVGRNLLWGLLGVTLARTGVLLGYDILGRPVSSVGKQRVFGGASS